MAPISIATMQDATLQSIWIEKQLSSDKQIALVGGYW